MGYESDGCDSHCWITGNDKKTLLKELGIFGKNWDNPDDSIRSVLTRIESMDNRKTCLFFFSSFSSFHNCFNQKEAKERETEACGQVRNSKSKTYLFLAINQNTIDIKLCCLINSWASFFYNFGLREAREISKYKWGKKN